MVVVGSGEEGSFLLIWHGGWGFVVLWGCRTNRRMKTTTTRLLRVHADALATRLVTVTRKGIAGGDFSQGFKVIDEVQ